MAHRPVQQTTPTPQVHDELILVVKRSLLIDRSWYGVRSGNTASFLQTVVDHQEFLPRSLMEQDPTYKQVIPYIIFIHKKRYFLMQRRSDASEKRLQNKYTLGIGGHIRQEDMTSANITDWAQREFDEEIKYSGTLSWQPLGILNDDTNSVGQVHIGVVLLAQGDSADISIKSELKSGKLVTLDECAALAEQMETWSQLIVEHLKQH